MKRGGPSEGGAINFLISCWPRVLSPVIPKWVAVTCRFITLIVVDLKFTEKRFDAERLDRRYGDERLFFLSWNVVKDDHFCHVLSSPFATTLIFWHYLPLTVTHCSAENFNSTWRVLFAMFQGENLSVFGFFTSVVDKSVANLQTDWVFPFQLKVLCFEGFKSFYAIFNARIFSLAHWFKERVFVIKGQLKWKCVLSIKISRVSLSKRINWVWILL